MGRFKAIEAAFVDAEESPVVGHLIDEDIITF